VKNLQAIERAGECLQRSNRIFARRVLLSVERRIDNHQLRIRPQRRGLTSAPHHRLRVRPALRPLFHKLSWRTVCSPILVCFTSPSAGVALAAPRPALSTASGHQTIAPVRLASSRPLIDWVSYPHAIDSKTVRTTRMASSTGASSRRSCGRP
jgi:hypothetical protein